MACETNAKAIFPNRKIGKISSGYEASFLALKDNPLIDFEAIKNIRFGFKQGDFINLK